MFKFVFHNLRSKHTLVFYSCLLRNYHHLTTDMCCNKALHFASNLFLKRTLISLYYKKIVKSNVLLESFVIQDFKFLFSSDSKNGSNSERLLDKIKTETQKKGKKQYKIFITLLGTDNSKSITTVEEANKIAKRRNLQIVKESDLDPKSGRAVYRLLTESQLGDDKQWDLIKEKKEKAIMGHKLLNLKSSINEHDVITKAKSIKKWLTKKLEVRVVISGDKTSGENVYKIIEQEIGTEGRILQKRTKNEDIRFQVVPPKQTQDKNTSGE